MAPRTADEVRRAFVEYFSERGHTAVPSANLIPHDPSVLFTIAGMIPFIPYFVGDEAAPFSRAVSVQKCVRAGGKHNDLDDIGRTNRHFSFFEMLGNFSFGDYFKPDAIAWAWEWVTETLGIDPERLWVTVHTSDDQAETIWRDDVGVAPERIQRLDEENFWRMGDTGPCGPSSEIFFDLGPEHGADGGPADGGEDRYIEIWNLVFMQYDQRADGTRADLPSPSIDTGAGLERIVFVLQGADSIFDSDLFRPLIATAEDVTGVTYGRDERDDVSLRILAEHGRTMTFLIADGVVPSNEDRGYVLRRIIRRAVRHAYRLGVETPVTPALVAQTVRVMGDAYPDLVAQEPRVIDVARREEERFRQTLERGVALLDEVLERGDVDGDRAFFLHDSLGFPIDLTREIAQERERSVDLDGFEQQMADQRSRARQAHDAASSANTSHELFREIVDTFGPTEFTGRAEYETEGTKVLAVIRDGERVPTADQGDLVDVVLDRTPFYAESGGQVGDTGTIVTANGSVEILDTQYGLPGSVVVHRGEVSAGSIQESDEARAAIDGERRDRIRRNHTATHVLHWALREVLGVGAAQAGSLVAPDRLRFDFSHHEAVTRDQLDEIEALANRQIISDAPVRHYETTREHAESIGAIAFFGEKYGDLVRVLEAGPDSTELCGGTHVHALGFIGPIKIVSESSIGSNLRRIEALTGDGALAYIHDEEVALRDAADMLKTSPGEVAERVSRLLDQVKELRTELDSARARQAAGDAVELAGSAQRGAVVIRRDGLGADLMRQLAIATRDALGSGIVAIVGAVPEGTKAALVVAVSSDLVVAGASAAEIAAPAASALGGGTAKNAELVVGGGPGVDGLDEALRILEDGVAAAIAATSDG